MTKTMRFVDACAPGAANQTEGLFYAHTHDRHRHFGPGLRVCLA